MRDEKFFIVLYDFMSYIYPELRSYNAFYTTLKKKRIYYETNLFNNNGRH